MRTRRGPCAVPLPAPAVPALAACGASAEDDVRGRPPRRSSTEWADGDLAAAAQATTDPEATDGAAGADRGRPARRHAARRTLGTGHRRGRDGHRGLDRDLGPRRRARLELRGLAATSSRSRTPGASSRRRRIVHPELGEGQHLELTRSLPERAPITDAAGAPLFTPTEVVNVGVDKDGVTDLPALAAALSAATGDPGRGHRRQGPGRPRGTVRAGHHPAPARSSRRSGPRCSTSPVPSSLRTPGCSRRVRASPRRCWAGSARRPPRSSRSRRTTAPRATSTATSSGCRGCSAPSRSSSPARPGSPSRW